MGWYLRPAIRQTWAYAKDAFTPEECDSIIEIGKRLGLKDALLNRNQEKNIEIRKGKTAFLDFTSGDLGWIYRRATDYVEAINKQFWNYDLQYIETMQFTSYTEKNDFYCKHIDELGIGINRKLSFSVQLSDPESYEGCDLLFQESIDQLKAIKDRGAIVFFPSFVLHEVTPLVSGERYSLVGWVCGPPFK